MLPVVDADMESPKSLHLLFEKCLGHMLVILNKILWSKLYKILSFLTKKKKKKKNG